MEPDVKVLIITGGSVEISFAAAFFKEYRYDLLIAVDKGIESAAGLGVKPDMLIGDFDSADAAYINKYASDKDIKVIRHNPVKDATDTELALDTAIDMGAEEITILGAVGTRIDHVLGNIHCLYKALIKNIKCVIWDEHNRIELVNSPLKILKNEMYGRYVSFLPFTDSVEGLSLKGFKYNLDGYTLNYGTSIGVSNEVEEDTAYVDFTSGILIYLQTKD